MRLEMQRVGFKVRVLQARQDAECAARLVPAG